MADYAVASKQETEAELNARIKQFTQLPDSAPEKYAELSVMYRDLEAIHHQTRKAYLESVPQKTVRRVDPNQPAFSDAAEILRANGVKQAQLPARVDAPGTHTNDSGYEITPGSEYSVESDIKGSSRGLVAKTLDFGRDLLTPRTTLSDLTSPEFLNNFAMTTTGGAAVGGLAGPGGMIAGGVAGALSAPLAYEGYKREIEKWTRMGYGPEEARQKAAISSSVLGLTSGLIGNVPQPVIKPITRHALETLSAEEMIGGAPVEVPRPMMPTPSPEAIPMPSHPSGYKVQPTGRFVLPTGAAPGISDLAQAHQAKVLEGSRTGAFHDPNSPPMAITHDTPTPMRTDRLLSTESEMPDVVQPFERSRALRSAEEIVQERQTMESKPLHGRTDQQIREALAFIPRGSSETANEGAALGALRGLRKAGAKERKLQEARELDIAEFAVDYVKERQDLKPSTLSGPVSLPSGPLPKTFDHLSAEAMFPSVKQRITEDVLTVIGRYSPAWKAASESILKGYEVAAKDAAKTINAYTDEVGSIFGKRNWFIKKGLAFKELTEGENIAIAKSQRAFNITPEIEEAAFNYLYTNGAMEPPTAIRDQVIKYAEATFKHMLQPTSSHPGNRMIKIHDPWTGELFDPGQPSMFVAHQPIKEMSRTALKDKQWEMLYNRMGGETRTKVGLEGFIKRVINFSKRDPDVGVEIFNMPNLQQKRMIDLSALGGSPYQFAKKLGYETDVFAMAVRYRASGALRGELELLRPGLDALKTATTGLDKESAQWLNDAVDFALKTPHGAEQVRENMTKALQAGRRWADIVLLPKAALTSMTQFAYPLAKSMGTPILGAKANLAGVADYVFGKNQELIKNSGALMPSVLNEFSHPTGPLAVLHSNTMKMVGMPLQDKQTRIFAGHIANRYINQLEKHFLANPTSKVHASILNDMGGPAAAQTILKEGHVNDELRLEMIQRFANQTSGVLDARGLPWYATSENPYAKTVLQYKPFLLANSTEIQRSIVNAPNKAVAASRLASLLGMGGTIGVGVYETKELINSLIQGNAYERPSDLDIRRIEAFIAGLGGAYSAATIDTLNDAWHNRLSMSLPIASYPSGLARDLADSVKHGPGWRSLRTVSALPVAGIVTKPFVEGQAKREAELLP